MKESSVVVVGAGIAGLTAGALLAQEGVSVTIIESHYQPGGCAGTFKRGQYIFDVGATQVAGLEKGGIHERIFSHLNLPLPEAKILDLACLVDFLDGSDPIRVWRDPIKWKNEYQRQFPGSEPFWALCSALHQSNWDLSAREPVIPPRNSWDVIQLIKAFRINNLPPAFFSLFSVADLLSLTGCSKNIRLRKFLDLQLKLYSQKTSDKTAALYGATVLQMPQEPLGLWHLYGSMQKISDLLLESFVRNGGEIILKSKVVALECKTSGWSINFLSSNAKAQKIYAKDIIFSPPPQCLLELIDSDSRLIIEYIDFLKTLPKPSGAIVFYGALKRDCLPNNLPLHCQLDIKELGSLFISISEEGDGRAPAGQSTLIASSFTETNQWFLMNETDYRTQKEKSLNVILNSINGWLKIKTKDWLHKELATPKSFEYWTGRPKGIVGGLGQSPRQFGIFGLPSRTPLNGLWLCGDSIYPGEGTAGVSLSALIACKQLMASRGADLNLAN